MESCITHDIIKINVSVSHTLVQISNEVKYYFNLFVQSLINTDILYLCISGNLLGFRSLV